MFAPPDRDGLLPAGRGLLLDTRPLIEGSLRLMHVLRRQSNAFLSVLAYSCLAHHVARLTRDGVVERSDATRAENRLTALAYRSMTMGLIVETNDHDLVERYGRELTTSRVLAQVEAWALPGQTEDVPLAPSLYIPDRVPLIRTASVLIDQINLYNDAYFRYLVTTAIPGVLRHDPTFGLRHEQLANALERRLDDVTDHQVHAPATDLLHTIKADHDR